MYFDPTVTTLSSLAFRYAQCRPNQPALVCDQEVVTYEQLAERSRDRVRQFAALGVSKGDRVGLVAKDGIASVELLFACALVGAVFVPINWRLRATEVAYIIEDAGCRLLFSTRDLASLTTAVGTNCRVVFAEDKTPATEIVPEFIATDENEAVVQIYTSGTTGRPKGVTLAHRTFFAIAREFQKQGKRWIGWNDSDVSLCAIPLFHIGGLWWLVRGLASGSANVLLPQFVGWQAIEAIARHRVTVAAFVPAMIAVILSEPDATPERFRSLRAAGYGGSPASVELIRRAMAVFDCNLSQVYGLTETGNMAVWLTPDDHRLGDHLLAAGRPFPGVEVKVVDRQGKALAPRSLGEICIRTPAVMLSYWRNPSATSESLRDGWIHTGDAGYLDADGYVHISDRLKDMICNAGENIYPAEIERVLAEHPAIREVAVIGVPHPEWGESVKAIVALRPGAELALRDMRAFCQERLGAFKVPTSLDVIDALPRTASGKIHKVALREKFWVAQPRRVG